MHSFASYFRWLWLHPVPPKSIPLSLLYPAAPLCFPVCYCPCGICLFHSLQFCMSSCALQVLDCGGVSTIPCHGSLSSPALPTCKFLLLIDKSTC